jgi:predicted transcriptional regulator
MDLKQLIRLHLERLSNRQISKTLGIGRNAVNTYIQLFRSSNMTFEAVLELNDPDFKELFPGKTTIDNDRYNQLMQYFEKMNHDKSHPGLLHIPVTINFFNLIQDV